MSRWIWLGLIGLAAGACLSTHRRLERERHAMPQPPEPLQRWEGEGGTVDDAVATSPVNAQAVQPGLA